MSFFFFNDGKGEALMVKPFLRVYTCLLLKIDIFLQRAVSAFTNCTFIQYFSTGLVSILDFILDCNKFPGLTVNQGQQQHDFPFVDECKHFIMIFLLYSVFSRHEFNIHTLYIQFSKHESNLSFYVSILITLHSTS